MSDLQRAEKDIKSFIGLNSNGEGSADSALNSLELILDSLKKTRKKAKRYKRKWLELKWKNAKKMKFKLTDEELEEIKKVYFGGKHIFCKECGKEIDKTDHYVKQRNDGILIHFCNECHNNMSKVIENPFG